MTNYNERLDEVLKRYVTLSKSESDAAKQAITSLVKELVAEAKPEALIGYYPFRVGYNAGSEEFEQSLLKELEEV